MATIKDQHGKVVSDAFGSRNIKDYMRRENTWAVSIYMQRNLSGTAVLWVFYANGSYAHEDWADYNVLVDWIKRQNSFSTATILDGDVKELKW